MSPEPRFTVRVTIDGMSDYVAARRHSRAGASRLASEWATVGGWAGVNLRIPSHRVVCVELIEEPSEAIRAEKGTR
jgi:hypothetical protein